MAKFRKKPVVIEAEQFLVLYVEPGEMFMEFPIQKDEKGSRPRYSPKSPRGSPRRRPSSGPRRLDYHWREGREIPLQARYLRHDLRASLIPSPFGPWKEGDVGPIPKTVGTIDPEMVNRLENYADTMWYARTFIDDSNPLGKLLIDALEKHSTDLQEMVKSYRKLGL